MTCLVCGFERQRRAGRPAGLAAVACQRCGSVTIIDVAPPTRELYDESYFSTGYGHDEPERSRFLDRLLDRLGPARGRQLLDSGCGVGLALDAGRRAGFTVTGFDRTEVAARLASRRGHAVGRAASEALPVTQGSNDVVLLLDVIAHVDNPRLAVEEATAALRPGGQLIVKTPRRAVWAYRLATAFPPRAARSVLHLPHQRHAISKRGLASMLVSNGLEHVTVERSGEASGLGGRLHRGWRSAIGAIAAAPVELLSRGPSQIAVGTRPRITST